MDDYSPPTHVEGVRARFRPGLSGFDATIAALTALAVSVVVPTGTAAGTEPPTQDLVVALDGSESWVVPAGATREKT